MADGVGRVGNGASRNQVGMRDTLAPFVYPYVLFEFFFSVSCADVTLKLNKIENN